MNLHEVVDLLVRRARREGSLGAGDVRAELARANLAESQWEEAVALAGAALVCRHGRYYPAGAESAADRRQARIERALARLIRRYKVKAAREERRHQNRVDFVQPVKVFTEGERELTLLSRDLSLTGIRLISGHSLLGQKVQLLLPGRDDRAPHRFLVRIVWACAVGDGLFENGGLFLDLFPRDKNRLRLVSED